MIYLYDIYYLQNGNVYVNYEYVQFIWTYVLSKHK
jgi:hypothetical protein